MLIPSCKYPDISSWDAGLLPHFILPVGILEYPVYTLGVLIVVLSFVGSDLYSGFFLSNHHSIKQFTRNNCIFMCVALEEGFLAHV
jgi:hypothetical protein